MVKVDTHVHSKFSGKPSDWFLQKFGTNQSYTNPENIYKYAKDHDMDFVTITDHNRIDGGLILKEKYPDDVIIGCECTTYFPEDGCKAHILLFGIDEHQFSEINKIRGNIYTLRDYIKNNNIAYSLAHATYSINGKLRIEHLEKFILLFDIFEVINGSRNKLDNSTWLKVLINLTPETIEALSKKHNIKPFSSNSWIKGLTGGSDDHAGLFIGRTYTESDANTIEEFLDNLKNKKTMANGRHNDYISFAFTLYKVLYDFSKTKSAKISNSFINQLSDLVFEKKNFNFINWIKVQAIKNDKKKDNESFKAHLYDLIDNLQKNVDIPFEQKFDLIFHKLSDIFDSFIKILIKSTKKSIKKGDLINIITNVASFIPSAFITIPFFSTLFHMYSVRPLTNKLEEKFLRPSQRRKKKILWFTDAINTHNGVSITVKKIGWHCFSTGRELKIVSAISESDINNELPPNFINIPYLYSFDLPHYETINIKIPSVLKTIEMLYEFEPDEVYISTPGPVGLLALLFAKLISAKAVGVYHTDFTEQSRRIVKEEAVADTVEIATKWFYEAMDKISVPTREYIDILENRGFNRSQMNVFNRGIDDDFLNSKEYLNYKINNNDKFTMLFAGRISEDKNIDFLIEAFNNLYKKYNKNIKLIIAGYGPYYDKLNKKVKSIKDIQLKGHIKRSKLPKLYSQADLFVFPSNTDTFGMVVLEAQCCGLPAIVTNIGGPKEIIVDKETGFIFNTNSIHNWINAISYVIDMKNNNPDAYIKLRQNARDHILKNFNWEKVLSELFEEKKYLDDLVNKDNENTLKAVIV